MCQISTVSNWIPVISALAGALVGFGASFSTAYFNQLKSSNEAKDQRKRDRLESLYEVLISIKMDYQGMVSDVFNKIHHDKQFQPKINKEIPPIIHLEMLVNLYIPEMRSLYKELVKSKDAAGEKYADALVNEYTWMLKEEKQKECADYLALTEKVIKSVENMQHTLSTIIKA